MYIYKRDFYYTQKWKDVSSQMEEKFNKEILNLNTTSKSDLNLKSGLKIIYPILKQIQTFEKWKIKGN